jgi:hypothetical protein
MKGPVLILARKGEEPWLKRQGLTGAFQLPEVFQNQGHVNLSSSRCLNLRRSSGRKRWWHVGELEANSFAIVYLPIARPLVAVCARYDRSTQLSFR